MRLSIQIERGGFLACQFGACVGQRHVKWLPAKGVSYHPAFIDERIACEPKLTLLLRRRLLASERGLAGPRLRIGARAFLRLIISQIPRSARVFNVSFVPMLPRLQRDPTSNAGAARPTTLVRCIVIRSPRYLVLKAGPFDQAGR